MSTNDRPSMNVHRSSTPPDDAPLESWDDETETVPGLDLDDPMNEFDRVTVIPDLPPDLYVQRVMESVNDSRIPIPIPGDTIAAITERLLDPEQYFTLDSRPPALPPSQGARDLDLELYFDDLGSPGAFTDAASSSLAEMKDRYAMGDFSGALVIAEGILDAHPDDLEAPRYVRSCREVLTQMYSARLGSPDQVVSIAVPADQIRWLTLDHRAGFLLSLVDDRITLDQLLDISGMTRLDALRIVFQLMEQRVIALG